MKKTIKLICLCLSLLLVLPLAVACTKGGDGDDTVDLGANNGGGVVIGGNDGQGGTGSDSYTPSGRKYDDATFNVLVAGQNALMINCFEYSEEAQTVLDTAIQKKNAAVEAEYDVKFDFIEDLGKQGAGLTKMQLAKNSNELEYHLSYVEVYSVVKLATQGTLYELGSIEGINLDNSWWDQKAKTDLSINGLQFFTTGDIDFYDDMQQFIVMFNRSLFSQKITDMTVDGLYETVSEGKWTFDKYYSLGKGLVRDADGDQDMDKDDEYGMLTWDDTIYAVFSAGGSKIVSNDNNTLTLSIIGDESAIARMTEYTEWTKDNAWNYSRLTGQAGIDMFSNDRALFFMGRLESLNNFRHMDSDFGIVPVPKFTEDQDYMVGTSTFHYSMICTLNLADDIDMRGDVIESCAYWSQQYLTPAYQEKTLEGQNIRDDGSLETLKIIAANRIYDIGFFIQPGRINAELIYLYRAWSTNYASKYEAVRQTAETDIESVLEAYKDLADYWAD